MKKIAVVGGGIAGLSAAYAVEKKAAEVGIEVEIHLLERLGRIGGNITTEKTSDGFLIEGGPDCVFSEKPSALKMCKTLGLNNELVKTNDEKKGTFVYSGGRLHPLPEGVILMVPTMIKPMLFSSLISFPGKLRMGMEPFIPKYTGSVEESLAQFVRRRLGQELLDKIAEPLVAGIHAGNADTMSINASFPRFVDLEQNHGSLIKGMLTRRKQMMAMVKGKKPEYSMFVTIKEGMQKLTDTMTAALKNTKIHLNSEVSAVTKNGQKYEIRSKDGNSIEADSVIIATPAYMASDMLKGLDTDLADLLNEINYVSTATVTLAYSRATMKRPPQGFGIIIPKISNRKIRAATVTSNKFSYRAPDDTVLIRVFIGGPNMESLVDPDDEKMLKVVCDELKIVMGIDSEPLLTRIHRWEKAWPQYEIGHHARIARIDESTANHPGLFVTGCAYKGIGISDSILNSGKIVDQLVEFLRN